MTRAISRTLVRETWARVSRRPIGAQFGAYHDTNTMNYNHQRQADRFLAKNSGDLNAELLVLSNDEVLSFPVELADISETGCAVQMSTGLTEGVSVAILRIQDLDQTFNIEVAGRLCWNQQTSLGANTFGFQFRRPMPSETIDEMVDNGWVTRRTEYRTTAKTEIEVRRSHGLQAVKQATLEDFSMTGIRLNLDTNLDVGERVLVSQHSPNDKKSPVVGSVTVKWVRPVGDSFECGCIFQNLASSRAINQAFSGSVATK